MRFFSCRILGAAAGLALLAACSGGGTSNVAPSNANLGPQSQQAATATVAIFIPTGNASSNRRSPRFVATTTQGIRITNSLHGSATTFATVNADLTLSGACTAVSGGRSCTVTMNSAVGSDDYTFATYDVTPSNANFGTAAHQLGSATLSNITISAGVTNTVNVALSGIIKSFSLPSHTRNFYSVYRPVAASASGLSINGLDADGNVVLAGGNTVTNGSTQQTDTYANPITIALTENGGTGSGFSGHLTLSLNGGSPSTSIQLTRSTDTFSVAYDGNASAGYYVTLSISASGATSPTPITVSTLSVSATGNASSVSVGGSTNLVGFNTTGQSETLTLTEPQFSGTFTAVVTNANTTACPSSPNPSVSIDTSSLAGSGTGFTLSAGTANTTGSGCQIVVSDPTGGATFTVGATASVTGTGNGTIGVPNNYLYASAFGSDVQRIASVFATGYNTTSILAQQTIVRYNLADGTVTNSFSGAATGLLTPLGIAHDSSGNVFAADGKADKILKFAANQSGNVAPAATITSTAMAFPDGLALDSSGRIYVADPQNQRVFVFAANASGASTPVATVTVSNGFNTLTPYALALDSAGDAYVVVSVATSFFVVELPPVSNGTSTPQLLKTFSLHSNGSAGVAVDPVGNVFIADSNSSEVDMFTPTQNPQLGATAVFSTSAAGFTSGLGGIAVDGNGNLYVFGYQNGSNQSQFATFTYNPSNPSGSTSATIRAFATPTYSGTMGQIDFLSF